MLLSHAMKELYTVLIGLQVISGHASKTCIHGNNATGSPKFDICTYICLRNTESMTKHVACRRSCPETVKNRIQQALQATLYILHQTGPTGFLLKEEGTSKKLKVAGETAKKMIIMLSFPCAGVPGRHTPVFVHHIHQGKGAVCAHTMVSIYTDNSIWCSPCPTPL